MRVLFSDYSFFLVLFLIYIYTDWIERLLVNIGNKLPGILFYKYDLISNKMNTIIQKLSDAPDTVDITIPKTDNNSDYVDESELYLNKIQSYFLPQFNGTNTFATLGDNNVVNLKSNNNRFKVNSYLNYYNTRRQVKNVTEQASPTQIPYFTNNNEKLTNVHWDRNESLGKKSKREKEIKEKNFKFKIYNYSQRFSVMTSFKNVSLVQENITRKQTRMFNFTSIKSIAQLEEKTK